MLMDLDNETIVTMLSALVAGFSFAMFALPYLQKSERKERFKSVIEKRRKALFEATRDGNKKSDTISAKDSMASFYKVQELAGEMGERVRSKMLQAGIRDPKAPVKFMLSQIVLPLLLCGWVILVLTFSETEFSVPLKLVMILGSALAGFKLPDVLLKNKILKRQQDINLAFPDALDMMLICVQGGIGLEQTIERVAQEVSDHSPILAEELGILSAEMAMLNDRGQALRDFARRVGSGAGKTFATSLIQAEQYGTSVSQAMRVMADELRDMRMALAEEKAASLPPKLTVPMILFFLPALFIVILGPAGIRVSAAM